ncbi:hypothetical protein H920_08481 [Fukomys damarensis]|uniref:Uncharacterized protein n=1 Tax=Fukomys damarensis TaxID=885580 RepID=A0A091DDB5_FUKDA|nr:hypothetical protein H920_08481 [Fukomys damarensis]
MAPIPSDTVLPPSVRELAQFGMTSRENALLQHQEEVGSESSDDSAMDDDLDHVSQRSCDSDMTEKVQNEDLDSDEEEDNDVN